EIGAVVQSTWNYEVEAEFSSFVRPVRHPELTDFCTELTGITQNEVDTAPGFPEALAAMTRWMEEFEDALFCSWGDYDQKQFRPDCAYHGAAYPFGTRHLNLKAEFARSQGLGKGLGIGAALRHLGMDFEGSPHRGLDDARNIARIVRRVCIGV